MAFAVAAGSTGGGIMAHRTAFDAWQHEAPAAPAQSAMPQARPLRSAGKSIPVPAQLNLFDGGS
jgi:hypothetical protein